VPFPVSLPEIQIGLGVGSAGRPSAGEATASAASSGGGQQRMEKVAGGGSEPEFCGVCRPCPGRPRLSERIETGTIRHGVVEENPENYRNGLHRKNSQPITQCRSWTDESDSVVPLGDSEYLASRTPHLAGDEGIFLRYVSAELQTFKPAHKKE